MKISSHSQKSLFTLAHITFYKIHVSSTPCIYINAEACTVFDLADFENTKEEEEKKIQTIVNFK